MKRTGLFFGSFNPVHVGHLIIADHMLYHTDLEEVWMVVSPHNPLKTQSSLANDYDRLHLVELALGDYDGIRASSIEFGLPKPSYTVDTLAYLREKYPDREFSLIMGGDNLATLHKWKNFEFLLANYHFFVYHRKGADLSKYADRDNVHVSEAPLLDLSATYIRKAIKHGGAYRFMLPKTVYDHIQATNMYT